MSAVHRNRNHYPPSTQQVHVWLCGHVQRLVATMGKKNSKLKQETIDRLTKDTYCEYLTCGTCPGRVARMSA